MKVAFYKGKNGNIADWLIMLWTLGKYSHVELVFSDGMSFSSSQWDGGTRFKKISYSHKDRWTFVNWMVTPEEEQEIREKAESVNNRKYDWLGIFFHQFLPFNFQDDKAWWCSEVCAWLLEMKPFRLSPNEMFRDMIERCMGWVD